jgi:hypothetical protein
MLQLLKHGRVLGVAIFRCRSDPNCNVTSDFSTNMPTEELPIPFYSRIDAVQYGVALSFADCPQLSRCASHNWSGRAIGD